MGLARSTAWLTVEKGAHVGGALLLMTAVARALDRSAFAGYGAAVSLTAFFAPFLDAGTGNRTIRSTAGEPAEGRAAVEAGLALKLRLALPVFVAMLATAALAGAEDELFLTTALIGAATIAMTVGDGFNAALKGRGRADASAVLIAGLNAALLAGSVAALHSGWGLVGVGLCYLAFRGAYLAAAFGVLLRLAPALAPSFWGPVGRATVVDGIRHLPSVLFLGNLLYACYMTTFRLEGDEAAAPWVLAYRAASAVFVLAGAGFEAVLPASRTWASAGSPRRAARMIGAYLAWGVLAGAALAGLAPLAPVVFGAKYEAAVGAIRTTSICVPPMVLAGVTHTVLLGCGRTRAAFIGVLAILVGGSAAAPVAGVFFGPAGTALVPALAAGLGGAAMAAAALRRAP